MFRAMLVVLPPFLNYQHMRRQLDVALLLAAVLLSYVAADSFKTLEFAYGKGHGYSQTGEHTRELY